MARIVETNIRAISEQYEGTIDLSGIDLSKISLSPSIIVLLISPILFAISPFKNIIRDITSIGVLYYMAKRYEDGKDLL